MRPRKCCTRHLAAEGRLTQRTQEQRYKGGCACTKSVREDLFSVPAARPTGGAPGCQAQHDVVAAPKAAVTNAVKMKTVARTSRHCLGFRKAWHFRLHRAGLCRCIEMRAGQLPPLLWHTWPVTGFVRKRQP